MKLWTRCAALLTGAALLFSLSACNLNDQGVSAQDAMDYIQGEMDAIYLGQYNENYLELLDMTQEEAQERHDTNVTLEAQRFLNYITVEYVSDDIQAQAETLIRSIYAKSRYSVDAADKLENGNYIVSVTVEPMDIMQQLTADQLNNIWLEVSADVDSDAMYDEDVYSQLDGEYAAAVMELVSGMVDSIGYEQPQSATIQLKLEDNVYTMVDTDFTNVDNMIIDYSGSYV